MHPIVPLHAVEPQPDAPRRSALCGLLKALLAILLLTAPLLTADLLAPERAMAHPTLGVGFQAAPNGEAHYYGEGYNGNHDLVPGLGGTLHIDVPVMELISLGASVEATGWQTRSGSGAGYEPNVMLDFFFVPRLRIPIERGPFHSTIYLAALVGPAVDVPSRGASSFPISGGDRSAGVGLGFGARVGYQFFYGSVGAFADVGATGHLMTYALNGVLGSRRVDSEMVWWNLRIGLIFNLEQEITPHERR